jgi:two-component system, OmpR family, KDP operon response regulator KdpE
MFDATVLIIEDELQIRRAVKRVALLDVKHVIDAETARDGIALGASVGPDLVVLDLGLPDADGLEVCREFRRWSAAPIIVLTARHSDREKVRLLDAGADDYITKPFSAEEFGARLRVQLRRAMGRAYGAQPGVQMFGHISLDLPGRTIRRHDRQPDELVRLTRTEWDLLVTLIASAGRTLTHAFLRERVWEAVSKDPRHDIRVHIANLRRKLERDPMTPELIITESGVGYRFERPE